MTSHGRPVYGGGGISPDVLVQMPEPNRMGMELWRQGKFFDFISEYRARHPNLTSAKITDEALLEFQNWLDQTEFEYRSRAENSFANLEEIAQEDTIYDQITDELELLRAALAHLRDYDFDDGKEFIRQALKSELAASLWGTRGRTEASFKDDPQLLEAIKILVDQQGYRALLALEMLEDSTR